MAAKGKIASVCLFGVISATTTVMEWGAFNLSKVVAYHILTPEKQAYYSTARNTLEGFVNRDLADHTLPELGVIGLGLLVGSTIIYGIGVLAWEAGIKKLWGDSEGPMIPFSTAKTIPASKYNVHIGDKGDKDQDY